jgi:hypothetical protein
VKTSKTIQVTLLALTCGATTFQAHSVMETKNGAEIKAGAGVCENCMRFVDTCRIKIKDPPEGSSGSTRKNGNTTGDIYYPDQEYYGYPGSNKEGGIIGFPTYCTGDSFFRLINQDTGFASVVDSFNAADKCKLKKGVSAPDSFDCGSTWKCEPPTPSTPCGPTSME